MPSGTEIAAAKDKIVEQILPVNTSTYDLIVGAPVAKLVDFTFNELIPNTVSMQDTIKANLKALFLDETTLGQNVKSASYESVIFQTVDPTTGQRVQDFNLVSPVGEIVIKANELPIINTITFI